MTASAAVARTASTFEETSPNASLKMLPNKDPSKEGAKLRLGSNDKSLESLSLNQSTSRPRWRVGAPEEPSLPLNQALTPSTAREHRFDTPAAQSCSLEERSSFCFSSAFSCRNLSTSDSPLKKFRSNFRSTLDGLSHPCLLWKEDLPVMNVDVAGCCIAKSKNGSSAIALTRLCTFQLPPREIVVLPKGGGSACPQSRQVCMVAANLLYERVLQ
mmetsp:Transcript_63860/g.118724  ORF Transcript_63860/g.118724 Transcript_63860/m.118724 type:complete len:215 (-) Transcript_63860:80-724(-)